VVPVSPILQKLLLGLTILLLVLVIAIPVSIILGSASKPNIATAMYISMFPQVANNNPEPLLGHSFIRSADGNVTLLPAKAVSVRGFQVGNTVNVIYMGGRDDAKLDTLGILVRKSSGPAIRQTYQKPTLNQKYPFPNMGTDGLDDILVTGTFTDGSQQILLMTEV
jgi:hypothetical protein